MKKLLTISLVMLTLCSCSVTNETELAEAEENTSVTELADTVTDAVTKHNTESEISHIIEDSYSAADKALLDVPFYDQSEYPTGCELVSASMLLAYHDFYTTPAALIDDGHIQTSTIHIAGDTKYGADPNKVFIGSPYDENSYGCYAGAIKNCLESYLPYGYTVADLSGTSLADICRKYIDAEIPVLVWASIDMRETYQKYSSSWIIEETGERFQWISGEHCLVLTGYDDSFYYFNDPLNDKNTAYKRTLAEKRYEELGMQALAVINIT